jgi:hypothetical protein
LAVPLNRKSLCFSRLPCSVTLCLSFLCKMYWLSQNIFSKNIILHHTSEFSNLFLLSDPSRKGALPGLWLLVLDLSIIAARHFYTLSDPRLSKSSLNHLNVRGEIFPFRTDWNKKKWRFYFVSITVCSVDGPKVEGS